jgi:hypothetical protein
VEVDGVDEESTGQVVEGDVTDQAADENFERLPPVDRRSHEPAEGDVGAGDLEDVAPAHGTGAGLHLSQGNARGPGRADERADARPDHQAGDEAVLFQRAKHADVGEPLEAAAAEDQGKRSVLTHSLAPAKVGCVTYALPRCKNHALRAAMPTGAIGCAAEGIPRDVAHRWRPISLG